MSAVKRLRNALYNLQIDEEIIAEIFREYPTIHDKVEKDKRAAFFIRAVERMDALLEPETCHAIRENCACSKEGWRLKAVQKLNREYEGRSLLEKIQALNQVTHMGKPVLNEDGTITARIGDNGGFPCPCPVFDGVSLDRPVSITYCYCCAGHFRHHYQIALGMKLAIKTVLSSALESCGERPCRFVYEILE
jgi:hypothetical protein